MKLLPGVVLLTIVIGMPTFAAAGSRPGNDKHSNKHAENHAVERRVEVSYLPPQDVRIIREYYQPRYRSLPPGLAKKYARTGHLPPGWEKKMEPLPLEVERRLVVLPPEYRRGYIEGRVVVYSPRTQVIVDIATVLGH
jgi:hypothetical protein